jgi:hypothetical protein
MVHLHVLISSCKPHDQGTKHLGALKQHTLGVFL